MEQRESQQPIDAEISRERAVDEFQIITDPEQREALAWCADRLIEKIVARRMRLIEIDVICFECFE